MSASDNLGAAQNHRLSSSPQWLLLGGALVWATLTIFVATRYHLAQPRGETSVTLNGHTYVGNPPSLTLRQRDPVSFSFIVIALAAPLVIGIGDLALRVVHQATRPGYASVIIGGLAGLFSLFGLLWGVASIGVVGLLIVLSARPLGMSQRAWTRSRYLAPS